MLERDGVGGARRGLSRATARRLGDATGQYRGGEVLQDLERCEYFVPVQWLQTVPLEEAVHEIGFFGNQNTVCKPTTPNGGLWWHG